jgi:septal ring factor EnvC (AmiA/AmiB activator)
MATPHDQAETVTTAPSLWRVRLIAALLFTIVALIATARAEERSLETQIDAAAGEAKPARKREQPARKPADEPARTPDAPRVDLRAVLAAQLAEEALAIERSLAMVTDKLRDTDATRMRRLAAAYRLLQAAPGEDRMATARQRAAARLLIELDLDERRLLAEEAAQLRTAAARVASDAAGLAELILPESIGRPARGPIIRRFGLYRHERSKATLSRRGIELDVDTRARVLAPADGTVRYAGPIRGLDSGVILDHGTYVTVLARLGEVVVPVNAPVARGDRLGRAIRHRVYLEVRVKVGPGGRPIDPALLIGEAGSQKR